MVASPPAPSPNGEGSKMRDTPDVKCKKRGKRRAKKCLFSLFGGHGEKLLRWSEKSLQYFRQRVPNIGEKYV